MNRPESGLPECDEASPWARHGQPQESQPSRRRPRGVTGSVPGAGSVTAKSSRTQKALPEVSRHLVERDPVLRHGVAVPDGHGLVIESVEVDRDAERRADLVLTA